MLLLLQSLIPLLQLLSQLLLQFQELLHLREGLELLLLLWRL